MVEELYKASQAGAQIDIIVWAGCPLVPWIVGLSWYIYVSAWLRRFVDLCDA
jgi:polyphosphate kinase